MKDGPLKRWWHNRRFLFAYRTLRNAAERHRALGHRVEFSATSEHQMAIICITCKEAARG